MGAPVWSIRPSDVTIALLVDNGLIERPSDADAAGPSCDADGRASGWVAVVDGRVVGAVSLVQVDPNTALVRDLLVLAPWRDTDLVDDLLLVAVARARAGGLPSVVTATGATEWVRRPLERHEFVELDPAALVGGLPIDVGDADVVHRRELTGVVALRHADPSWPLTFEDQRGRLVAALGDRLSLVEHVGSTSVPGLIAKPCIDIVVTVADPSDEAGYLPELERLGYRVTVREPEWFEHRCLRLDWPRVNLHVFGVGCPEVDAMIAFRDRLRRDRADRELYAETKRRLADLTWSDVQDYADAKSDVIDGIKRRAGIGSSPDVDQ